MGWIAKVELTGPLVDGRPQGFDFTGATRGALIDRLEAIFRAGYLVAEFPERPWQAVYPVHRIHQVVLSEAP